MHLHLRAYGGKGRSSHGDPQDRAGTATTQLCGWPKWAPEAWGQQGYIREAPCYRGLSQGPQERPEDNRTVGRWRGQLGHPGNSPPSPAGPGGEALSQPPAQHPVSFTNRMTATLSGRASHAYPASRPHRAVGGAGPCLVGDRAEQAQWDSPGDPSPGPDANRVWGLRREPLSPPPEIQTAVSKSYRTGWFWT